MDTADLQTASGVSNVARVVGGLVKRHGGRFAPAITRPGGKGRGGYFVRVTPAGR